MSKIMNPPLPSNLRAAHGTVSSVHLNAARGAAALVVLLGHTRSLFFSSLSAFPGAINHLSTAPQSVPDSTGVLPGPITMGNEAVIIFFVLSGYLVGGSAIRDLKNGTWSWKRYLTQRLTRLWVVLLPALLLGIALDHSGLRMFAGTHSIYSGPPDLCVVPCNLADRVSPKVVMGNAFFLQEIFVDTAGSNNALWSLANEFWYYLAFPLCLLAAQRGQPMLRRAFYAALVFAIAALVGKAIFLLFFVWLLRCSYSRPAAEGSAKCAQARYGESGDIVSSCHRARPPLQPVTLLGRMDRCPLLLRPTLFAAPPYRAGAGERLQEGGRLLVTRVVHLVPGASSTSGFSLCLHQHAVASLG